MTTPLDSTAIERLRAWLALDYSPHLSLTAIRTLLGQLGTPEAVLAATHHQISQIAGERAANSIKALAEEAATRRLGYIDAAMTWLLESSKNGDKYLLTWDNPAYPQQLLTIADPPLALYVQGNVAALQAPAVGMVGARNATQQGIANARAFAAHVAQRGVVVVSGMALGIDAAAHEGALTAVEEATDDKAPAALVTVAIIGTGIDRVYPAAHRDLAHRIAANGAVVSEFPIGTGPLAHNFPRRNRLISGLSRGVLVVEAAVRSGSLITARVAGEQGREVLAIPGSIHAPLSRGCHQLIKQGAKLVESGQDVLEELGLDRIAQAATRADQTSDISDLSELDDESQALATQPQASQPRAVLAAIGYTPTSFDHIIEITKLSTAQAMAQLTELELLGQVEMLAGGRYQRLG